MVEAFFAGARRGDFDALVTLLDPEVVLRADGGVKRRDASVILTGAAAVAGQALMFAQPLGAGSADPHPSVPREWWSP